MEELTMAHTPKGTLTTKGPLIFYLCFLAWFLANGIIFLKWPQSTCFLWINHSRSLPADLFFTGLTYLGNGITIVCIGIILILCRQRSIGIGVLFSYAISGIVTLLIKHHFNLPRPAAYITPHSLVETASWITLYYKHSFPSGHSTSIFAAATTISLFLPRKRFLAVICFVIACLTAYSRVYLGEHFVEDIWVGSFVGVFSGTLCFLIQENLFCLIRKREIKESKRTAS